MVKRLFYDYGMLGVLLLLCVLFGFLTYAEQQPTGDEAARQLAKQIEIQFEQALSTKPGAVLIATRAVGDELVFAQSLQSRLQGQNITVVGMVGSPSEALQTLKQVVKDNQSIDLIACTESSANWLVFDNLASAFPQLKNIQLVQAQSYYWPNFFKANNLLNIANQIAVIAIIAIGMTFVIITAGIDLSVGSLIALSAVVATRIVRDACGAEQASAWGMSFSCLAAILLCAGSGLFTGVMITSFKIPPFIVSLAMMLVARGLAFTVTDGQSIYQVPDSFTGLGRGTMWGGIPYAVVLMLVLYVAAQVLMTRTRLGRHLYAVGGNSQAARLSGIRVERVLLFAYTACAALAGLGGVIMASQFKSGAPTYGQMYELYVIAAVVVGGTSLSGGEGKMFGTLIGALIIAVIQNGMNLTNVQSYTQNIVLGCVILAAVIIDCWKRRRHQDG